MLFADLVGFTTISERRDAEDVREVLSRYFDAARDAVERHGGLVEKFIGDAVMAVWGTPTAHEDDAERSVRAALELVEAVEAFGRSVGLEHWEKVRRRDRLGGLIHEYYRGMSEPRYVHPSGPSARLEPGDDVRGGKGRPRVLLGWRAAEPLRFPLTLHLQHGQNHRNPSGVVGIP